MSIVKKLGELLRDGGEAFVSKFYLEAKRSAYGMTLTVSGVIAIPELTESCIRLSSHTARCIVIGSRLRIDVFKNHTVEIMGKVEDVRFVYGKN